MLEAVHTDLETGVGQGPDDPRRRRVILGHEIEGGPEAHPPVDVHQSKAPLQTLQAVDVVVEDQGEILAFGPAAPIAGRFRGIRVDGPTVFHAQALLGSDHPPDRDLQAARDDRRDLVKEIDGLHQNVSRLFFRR